MFHHIALTCSDPIEVERFYTRYFGFRRARLIPLGDRQVVFIKTGNLYLELFQKDEERPYPPVGGDGPHYPGWRHIAFKVRMWMLNWPSWVMMLELPLGHWISMTSFPDGAQCG